MRRKDDFDKIINRFNVSHMGLWEMTPENHMVYYIAKFYEQFDLSLSNSTLSDWIQLIHPEDRHQFTDNVQLQKSTVTETFMTEYRVINKDGKYVWIEAQGIANFDKNGNMLGILGTHTDITLRKEYESKLYNEAYVDEHTGLCNANKLIVDIENDLSNNIDGTILFIDFSHINHLLTVYGQDFIDQLITEANKILISVFSEVFDIYRFIPFVFSFKTNQSVDEQQIKLLCKQMEKEIIQLNATFDLSSEVIYNAVMMSYPQEEYFSSCEDMFNRIFLTLEEVKDQSGTLSVYNSETKKRIRRNMFIETNLHKSLENNEFYPVFQPIISAKEKNLLGFEALCRWYNSTWGPIYPNEFIAPAERSGAIIKLGAFMVDAACAFIQAYNKNHDTDLSISINASVIELQNPDFFRHIRSTLKKHQLKPSNLIIEITESLMLDDNDFIINQLELLKSEGVGVAIDDFGTGYSSINTMFSTPITEVKIDREVMLKLIKKPMTYDFIESLTELCQNHQIIVVAEGIEDIDMMNLSLQLNIDYLQGYLFGKPMRFDDAMKYKS